jgi:hypothetical protein
MYFTLISTQDSRKASRNHKEISLEDQQKIMDYKAYLTLQHKGRN